LRGAKRRRNPFSFARRDGCFAESVIGRTFAQPVGSQWRKRLTLAALHHRQ